jgi:hypothetical protein
MLNRAFTALDSLGLLQSLQIGARLARGHTDMPSDLGCARGGVLAKEVDNVLLPVLA